MKRSIRAAVSVSALCTLSALQAVAQPTRPATHPSTRPTAQLFVDPLRGDDAATGATSATAFRSLERARDVARRLDRATTGDIVIHLAPGEHLLTRPLTLTHEDSPAPGHQVIYRGPDVGGAIITGGVALGTWTLHDRDKGIWRAAPQGMREVETRQLFVNGRRATRAYAYTTPADYNVHQEGYLTTDERLATFKALDRAELVYRAIWTNPRCMIQSVARQSDGKLYLRMQQPGFDNGRKKGITSINKPWRIENAFELIDAPGEWYLDQDNVVGNGRGVFYYKPHRWEDMSRAEAVAPVLEHLIRIEGPSADRPAQNITLSNLEFRHTTWLRPSTGFGLSDAQNCVLREHRSGHGEHVPDNAAVRTQFARGITIDRSRFTRLGGIGVLMLAGSQRNTIQGCTFVDLAGSGIQIGNYTAHQDKFVHSAALTDDASIRLIGNRISDNFFDRCGVEYRSSTAIAVSFPVDSVISHNEIRNMPYSGIHIGWGWNRIARTATGGNFVENNHIRNVMLELADGGAIYTLGPGDTAERPNVLRGNYARQIRMGQAWYLDEGSRFYELVDNFAESVSDYVLKMNGNDKEIRARGIYADKDRNLIRKGTELLELEPTRRIDQNPEHRSRAEAIRANAGVRPEFAAARVRVRDPIIYEAEEAALAGGAIATPTFSPPKGWGYLGMAYVDGLRQNASITFDVSAYAGPGKYEVRVRYQALEGEVKGLTLAAGNAEAIPLSLPGTDADRLWSEATAIVTLTGTPDDKVRLTMTAPPKPWVLIDRIELTPAP